MPPVELQYQPPTDPPGLVVEELPDGGVTITVPSKRGTFLGVLGMLASAHPAAALATPLVWPVYKLFGSPNPRAVVSLTRDQFTLTETSDDGLGYMPTVTSWARAGIGELRANRYSKGLYFRIPGKANTDLLVDLSPRTIKVIGEALEAAQARLAKSGESAGADPL